MFGGSGASGQQSGGLFGGGAIKPLFGGATNTATTGSGLFGSQAPTTAAAPLFGTSTGTQNSGLFGGQTQAAASPFGATATQPTATAPTAGGLFGGSTAAAAPSGGLFGGGAAAQPAQPSGGLFGATATAAPTVGLFGGAPPNASAISDAKPLTIQQPTGSLFGTATAPQQATSSLFGAPAVTAPAAGGGLFSGQSQPTATSAAPSSLFGAPAAATAQTATAPLFGTNTAAAPATASAASLFQLPGTGGASTATATGSLLAGTSTPVKPATTSLFTGTATPTSSKPAVGGSSLFAPRPSATSFQVPAIPAFEATKPISYGEMEKVINNLIMDVLSHEKIFLNQALEVNSFDREIRDNQKKLIEADKEVTALEESKDRLFHNLSFIDMQQKELEGLVVDLEKKLGLPDWTDCNSGFPLDLSYATNADQQRSNIMKLLTSVDAQVKEADDDLNEINDQLVELNKTKETGDDTVGQIQRILKKQLENITWIDNKTEEISEKTSKLTAAFAAMPDA